MERMVNNRLVWYLEKNKIITPEHGGFRKQRSTTDHIIRLESFVREAFVNRQHAVAVFFDLEKAYDTAWRYGVMQDLHNAGLRGRLPLFIDSFLQDRNFKVRVGSTYSDLFDQETGYPQGSILSVTLFCLKINSIVKSLHKGVESSLYVDDFSICYRSKHIHIIERHVQLCLNKLQIWADMNGFKFSSSKTVSVHFCHLRKAHPDPFLTLYDTAIPVVEEAKFLGVILDRKLTLIPHLKYVREKCMKALNLIRVVAHTTWGADQQTLLHLYRSLIRSKLDYGCIMYGSARSSYLKMLDPIQNQALRLCLGAFRTSPSTSLHVEANELPLEKRRKKLSLQYALKLSANNKNPAYSCVFFPKCLKQFEKKPCQIRPFCLRVKDDLRCIGFKRNIVLPSVVCSKPPWFLSRPLVDFSLSLTDKDSTSSEIYKTRFLEFCDSHQHYQYVYTDGSKLESKVACAVVHGSFTKSIRLHDHASIYTAELHALLLALQLIQRSRCQRFVIFSDSLSALKALASFKIVNDLVLKAIVQYTQIENHGKRVKFCWVPGHMGIKGNEEADRAAKTGLQLDVSRGVKIAGTDFGSNVNKLCYDELQNFWNDQISNKLHAVKPLIGITKFESRLSRHELSVVNRLRIGHTRLTHGHILTGDPTPQCNVCNCQLTVKHILLDCISYGDVRCCYFSVTSLKELFESVSVSKILGFVRDINLFHSL